MSATIRIATPEDAEQIAAIYAPFVTDTAISFETEAPDPDEMERRILGTLERYPWLVCERDDEILGYCYAGQHRTRSAYQWSVDTSVYTRPDFRRCGLGRALYTSILGILPLQGFYNVYAGVTIPNPASVGLHEAMGFTPVGSYRNVGFKFGRWHDVAWWQRPLRPHSDPESAPIPLSSVAETDAFRSCLTAGLSCLRI